MIKFFFVLGVICALHFQVDYSWLQAIVLGCMMWPVGFVLGLTLIPLLAFTVGLLGFVGWLLSVCIIWFVQVEAVLWLGETIFR